VILIYTNQNSKSIGREPDHAASGLLQELIKFGYECSSAVWSEATLQGRMPARPTCAPSRLIQAQTDRTPAGLLGGLERSDITEVT
jgi:hypothetical protein